MKYKLVCIDMDGTLLNKKKKVSEFTKETLKKAHGMGVHIVITTGRIYNNAAYFSDVIGVKSPVIAGNGAIIREKDRDEVIFKNTINPEDGRKILEIARKYKITPHFHTHNNIYLGSSLHRFFVDMFISRPLPEELKVGVHYVNSMALWEKVLEKHKGEFVKCIMVHQSPSRLKKARMELEKISGLHVMSSGKYNLEIVNKDVSKGKAVEMLAKYYNISREEVICIGDNENDLSMIEYAGLGIAMGNSIQLLKDKADYITDSNDKDGVAKAIEKFILNN